MIGAGPHFCAMAVGTPNPAEELCARFARLASCGCVQPLQIERQMPCDFGGDFQAAVSFAAAMWCLSAAGLGESTIPP